jgi:hypothetical protein
MILVLIKIRLIQLKREIPEIRFLCTLVLSLTLAVLCLYAGIYYRLPQPAFIISSAILTAVCIVHFRRSDLSFIVKHIPKPAQNMYAAYLVFYFTGNRPGLAFKAMVLFSGNAAAFILHRPFKTD